MKNELTFKTLIDGYNELSYTHNYILGFADRGNIYFVITTKEILPYVCTLDKASRGCGYSLRFKPTKEQKETLKTFETFNLCSEMYFNEVCGSLKYNRGEVFEKMVTEYFGQKWEKDNVPFTKSGDIVEHGNHYQIKYEKATFINEKTLNKMMVA